MFTSINEAGQILLLPLSRFLILSTISSDVGTLALTLGALMDMVDASS
jgi:hypothetical protein